MRPGCALLLLALATGLHAQTPAHGVLLVAKPGMQDPRFRETVVLVTQTTGGETVGVILNRPLSVPLSDLIEDESLARRYREPLFYGGPVLGRTLVALFEADAPPREAAHRVLKNLYLSMHQDLIQSLLSQDGRRYRLYAGFAGWTTGQLRGEIERNDWLVVPATPEIVFRSRSEGLWRELIEKARAERAAAESPRAILAS
jgi:putative transcriptional regulator